MMMKKEIRKKPKKRNGVSLRYHIVSMGVLIIAISVLLLVFGRFSIDGYARMQETTADYIAWQGNAYNLQAGSDYLTEQVRYFAVTGDPQYLNNYFEEANVTRRRDQAVEALKTELSGSSAYDYLQAAMKDSLELMQREYYAMRLTIEGYGYDVSGFPEVIQETHLTSEDEVLSADDKKSLALTMLVDEVYLSKKESISSNIKLCMEDLIEEIRIQELQTMERMRSVLFWEYAFIIIMIATTLFFLFVIIILALRPMSRASELIKEDQPLPNKGFREFRFLARTINLMREANIKKTGELAFESTHDSLTGIYNRTGYDHLLKELDFSETAFLIVDVDNFKQINDGYGHEAGDKGLSAVATALRQSFRPQDDICRIGGDEFVVIVQDVGREQRHAIKRKIDFINRTLSDGDEEADIPPVSISVGGAFAEGLNDPEELFRRADAALYTVKENGRKGCAFYQK